MTPIHAAGLAITPWKNGAGRRADIATGPGWIIGYAWLDHDAPFSDYSGHGRTITLVEGAGFALRQPDGRVALDVQQRFVPASFDGGLVLHCIINGPCRVLNVMTLSEQCSHSIEILPSRAMPAREPVRGTTSFVVALDGPLSLATAAGTVVLEPSDAMLLTEPLSLATDAPCTTALITINHA